MTTINTLDDFLEALDANPSWREAVRSRILGEELLLLPVRFSAFTTQQEAWNARQDAWNAKQDAWNENAIIRFDRIEADMSSLKGDYARTRTIQDARGIASDLGLEYVRTLSNDDLNRMAGSNLDRDVLRSFRNADLVPERGPGNRSQRRDGHPVHRYGDLVHRRPAGLQPGHQKRRADHPVHRKPGPGGDLQRQERPGFGISRGIRSRVLARAGGPDSGSGVSNAGQTTGPDSTQSLNEEMEQENPDLQFRTSMHGRTPHGHPPRHGHSLHNVLDQETRVPAETALDLPPGEQWDWLRNAAKEELQRKILGPCSGA